MELDRQKQANEAVRIQYIVYRQTTHNTTQPPWKIFFAWGVSKEKGVKLGSMISLNFSEQATHRKKHQTEENKNIARTQTIAISQKEIAHSCFPDI